MQGLSGSAQNTRDAPPLSQLSPPNHYTPPAIPPPILLTNTLSSGQRGNAAIGGVCPGRAGSKHTRLSGWIAAPQQTRHVDPMLVLCWPSVVGSTCRVCSAAHTYCYVKIKVTGYLISKQLLPFRFVGRIIHDTEGRDRVFFDWWMSPFLANAARTTLSMHHDSLSAALGSSSRGGSTHRKPAARPTFTAPGGQPLQKDDRQLPGQLARAEMLGRDYIRDEANAEPM